MSQRCALAEKLIQTTPFSNIWCIRLIVLNENTQKSEHIISSTAVFFMDGEAEGEGYSYWSANRPRVWKNVL